MVPYKGLNYTLKNINVFAHIFHELKQKIWQKSFNILLILKALVDKFKMY